MHFAPNIRTNTRTSSNSAGKCISQQFLPGHYSNLKMKADEKKAFEAMLAEISDSDLDEEEVARKSRSVRNTKSFGFSQSAEPKPNRDTITQVAKVDYYNTYKASKEEQAIENFGNSEQNNQAQLQSEQMNITKRWLTRPCSRSDRSAMKCYVERERSTLGLQTTYRLFGEGNEGQQSRFMMAAKKKVNKQTSYYLISLDMDPTDDRGSESVLGKIRGNTIGSRYLITDAGLAPEKTVAPSMLRKELAVIDFEFDSSGPSRIEAWIPSVSASGVPVEWRPPTEGQGMEYNINNNKLDKMFLLRNKAPKWDEAHGGHVLNFQGRVTESSVKNFQLCCADTLAVDDPEEVILQFGRIGKNKFTLDLKFPLSPLQAFGVAIGCLDGKLADRKGYEFLRRMSSATTAAGETTYSTSGGGGAGGVAGQKEQLRQSDGSMKGSGTIAGMIRETLPSSEYLRDKWNRSFK